MPELPEVETTLRGIAPYITHQVVSRIIVRQPQLRWTIPEDIATQLQGQMIIHCQRRAKYMLLQCPKGTLLIHLGMSGSLRIFREQAPKPDKHDHVDILFKNGTVLRYHDPRRFGAILWFKSTVSATSSSLINTIPKNDTDISNNSSRAASTITNDKAINGKDETLSHIPLLAHLGPEPLEPEFTGEYLYKALKTQSRAIKLAIMDNTVVVGVGNIYANESLFLAGILPTRTAKSLRKKDCENLVAMIKKVLLRAIEVGGSTLRDFVDSEGKSGYFQQEYHVYGRDGEPCKVCTTPIKKTVIGQRGTFFCPKCQK
ncbi:bifunctional DNA-formamidopyrimidine glycosylase/DNA-(apurinic or apyrimidinic site) lyase [Pelistega europaea]|uniref:Formamidopyrimidine-DNA glycosylase n=1 Tax=Pelistega europaea TaxID=106147 RepID=A0A7Y4L9P3_9BURK|nr:bifunctional DNA-formamidopyrimidine glycosylase/DNA-(apurinic or apyrimidinic site) lyase [Pelistega europaea]NOL49594.1 bifunctional DNA-formamidopyrimidine glycosylase/DNA-(apurinic or apyrimidinic site) lyase [Pelistega europaea]